MEKEKKFDSKYKAHKDFSNSQKQSILQRLNNNITVLNVSNINVKVAYLFFYVELDTRA